MIRALTTEDAEAVAALVRAAFAAIPLPLDPPPSALRLTPADVLAQEGGAVWVTGIGAGMEAGIGGCVLWRTENGALYLNRLAVRPGLQGQGVGQRLLDAGEAEARRRGFNRLTLRVRLQIPGNRRLFAAAGFREVREHAHLGYTVATFADAEKML